MIANTDQLKQPLQPPVQKKDVQMRDHVCQFPSQPSEPTQKPHGKPFELIDNSNRINPRRKPIFDYGRHYENIQKKNCVCCDRLQYIYHEQQPIHANKVCQDTYCDIDKDFIQIEHQLPQRSTALDPGHKYYRDFPIPKPCNQRQQYVMPESDYRLMMDRPVKNKPILDPCVLPDDTPPVYRMKQLQTTLYKDELRTAIRYNGFQIPTQRVYVREDVRDGKDQRTEASRVYMMEASRKGMEETAVPATYFYDTKVLRYNK